MQTFLKLSNRECYICGLTLKYINNKNILTIIIIILTKAESLKFGPSILCNIMLETPASEILDICRFKVIVNNYFTWTQNRLQKNFRMRDEECRILC